MFVTTNLKNSFSNLKKYFLFFPIIVLSIGFSLGILFGKVFLFYFNYPFFLLIVGGLLLIVSLSISNRVLSSTLLFVTAFLFGFLRMFFLSKMVDQQKTQSMSVLLSEQIQITGLVKDIEYKNGDTFLVIGNIKNIGLDEGFVKLRFIGKQYGFAEDDNVSANVFFEMPENWGEFDYVSYLERQNIFLLGEGSDLELLSKTKSLSNVIGHLRNEIIRKTRTVLSEPESSLLLGLTIGYRADFDKNFEESLRKTGTTHVIAVSGYNVTLLIAILTTFFSALGKNFSKLVTPVLLILFCFLTGFNISVVRASLMFFFIWLSILLGRECSPFLGLSYASLLILIMNPFFLWDISFQLSFLSTIGLIIGGAFNISFSDLNFWKTLQESMVTTLWAFIFTLPVIIYNFSSFTFLTFLSNLLILPFVNISTVLGLVFIVGVLVNFYLGVFLSYFLWPFLYLFHKIIYYISRIPFGIIDIKFDLKGVFIYYFSLFFLISVFKNNDKNSLLIDG